MLQFEPLQPENTQIAAKILGACFSYQVERPFLEQEVPLLLSGFPFAPVMLLAKQEDTYIGCGVLGVHGSYTISRLGVLPQFQSMGNGTAIVTFLTGMARKNVPCGTFLAIANRPCL